MQYGHCNVELRDDLDLGLWTKYQREAREHGFLSDDRVRRLDGIGFVWEPRDVDWDTMFDALVQFKQQYGHCHVPLKWPENPRLGRWSEYQRRSQRHGKLSKYRQRRLKTLGFEWDSWEAMFASLLQFKQQHGHCAVSQNDRKNLTLGLWVDKQRRDRRRGHLSDDRIRRLDETGFTWGKSNSLRNDHSSVITEIPTAGIRRTVDWEAMLNEVANVRPNVEWEAMFNALVRFKQQHGHCNVPRKFPESPELAKWTERQRLVHELGGLTEERQKRLEELGFEWSQYAAKKKEPGTNNLPPA